MPLQQGLATQWELLVPQWQGLVPQRQLLVPQSQGLVPQQVELVPQGWWPPQGQLQGLLQGMPQRPQALLLVHSAPRPLMTWLGVI